MAKLVVNAKYTGGVDPEELKRKIYWELNRYYQLEVDDIEIKALDSDVLIEDYMTDTFGHNGLGIIVQSAMKKLGVELTRDVIKNKKFYWVDSITKRFNRITVRLKLWRMMGQSHLAGKKWPY